MVKNADSPAGKRVLVVGSSWVGDMVLSQGLYRSLKQRTPDIEIHVAAPAWSKALLRRMPEVAKLIEIPAAHGELNWKLRRKLGYRLRRYVYDQAIVLPRSWKSALLPWFAAVPLRSGYLGEMRYGLINDIRVLDKVAMPRIIDRFVFLGQPRGTAPGGFDTPSPCLRVSRENRDHCLTRLEITKAAPLLMLAPGAAFGRSKQWPPAYFAGLADHYADKGWQVWMAGSQCDLPAAEAIVAAASSPVVNLCGRTTLEDTVDLFSLADLAVTNDSGLMHVAAAVGCPVVAIYGATTPVYTPPMISRRQIIYRDLHCSPCWKRTCRYGHYHCLSKIMPDEVCHAAAALEKEPGGAEQS